MHPQTSQQKPRNKIIKHHYLNSSDLAFLYIRPLIRLSQEEVWVSCLNANKQVIASDCLFRGSVDQCPIHPREIFSFAIKHGASCFLMYHSHPSGDPTPSKEDLKLTKQIQKASSFLKIPLVDHIVIARDSYFSFVDEGVIQL